MTTTNISASSVQSLNGGLAVISSLNDAVSSVAYFRRHYAHWLEIHDHRIQSLNYHPYRHRHFQWLSVSVAQLVHSITSY